MLDDVRTSLGSSPRSTTTSSTASSAGWRTSARSATRTRSSSSSSSTTAGRSTRTTRTAHVPGQRAESPPSSCSCTSPRRAGRPGRAGNPSPRRSDRGIRDELTLRVARRSGSAVKPRRGDAVLFFSFKKNGGSDIASTHASCPTVGGVVDRHEVDTRSGSTGVGANRAWTRNPPTAPGGPSRGCANNPAYMLGGETPGKCPGAAAPGTSGPRCRRRCRRDGRSSSRRVRARVEGGGSCGGRVGAMNV